MPAFIVFESNGLTIRIPHRTRQFILMAEQLRRRNQTTAGFYFENTRHLETQFVSRFCIFLLMQFGLCLIGRRRFHIIYVTFFYRTNPTRYHRLGIGRPLDIRRIIIAQRSILTQLLLFTTKVNIAIRRLVGRTSVLPTDKGKPMSLAKRKSNQCPPTSPLTPPQAFGKQKAIAH